jgi:hypothetical protein
MGDDEVKSVAGVLNQIVVSGAPVAGSAADNDPPAIKTLPSTNQRTDNNE